MTSISENLKEGLKYPLIEKNKFMVVYVLNILIFALIIFSNFKLIDNFTKLPKDAFTVNSLFSSVSPEVIIGFVVVLIISIFLKGYAYKVLESGINHSKDLPDFNVNLFVPGIKLFVVEFIYAFIPAVVLNLGMANSIWLFIFGIIFLIIFSLFAIVGEAHMIGTGSFKAAFAFGKIVKLIRSIGILNYIGALIFYEFAFIIISISLSIILFALILLLGGLGVLAIAIVGVIILSLLYSYIFLSKFYLYGTIYDLMNESK